MRDRLSGPAMHKGRHVHRGQRVYCGHFC
jgi:hypothetical protein